jgi:hypothetical protein
MKEKLPKQFDEIREKTKLGIPKHRYPLGRTSISYTMDVEVISSSFP